MVSKKKSDPKKTKIFSQKEILKQALDLIAEEGWASFNLNHLAQVKKIPQGQVFQYFSKKGDVLEAFVQMTNQSVLEQLDVTPDETLKDRLFEAFMTRLEALAPYKPGIRVMWKELWKDPKEFACFMGHLLKGLEQLSTSVKLDKPPFCHELWLTGMGLAYVNTLRVWLEDDTNDQGKTMAMLDKSLTQLFYLLAFGE